MKACPLLPGWTYPVYTLKEHSKKRPSGLRKLGGRRHRDAQKDQDNYLWDFPGGPVVKSQNCHCRRHRFHPLGILFPQAQKPSSKVWHSFSLRSSQWWPSPGSWEPRRKLWKALQYQGESFHLQEWVLWVLKKEKNSSNRQVIDKCFVFHVK